MNIPYSLTISPPPMFGHKTRFTPFGIPLVIEYIMFRFFLYPSMLQLDQGEMLNWHCIICYHFGSQLCFIACVNK